MFTPYRGNNTPAVPGGYMESAIAGGAAMRQGLTSLGEAIGKRREQQKVEAQKTSSLRQYLSLIDPDNKDVYATKGLGELEGSAMAIAEQQVQKQQEARTQALQQETMLRAMQMREMEQRLAQQAGFGNVLRQATAAPLEQDLTPQNLLRAATQYPGAVGEGNLMRFALEQGDNAMPFTADDVKDLGDVTGNPALKGRIVTRQTPQTWTQPINVSSDQQLDRWLAQEKVRFDNSVKRMDRQALLNRQRDIKQQLSDGLSGLYMPEAKRLELATELQSVEEGLQGKATAPGAAEVLAEYEWRDGKLMRK